MRTRLTRGKETGGADLSDDERDLLRPMLQSLPFGVEGLTLSAESGNRPDVRTLDVKLEYSFPRDER